jgi:peptide/nickel transport system substrate-binding protein
VSRYTRMLALVGVLAVVGAACAQEQAGPGPAPVGGAPQEGGTLNLAISADISEAWDPAKEYEALAWEVYRCCLTRTLVSYNGQEADEGGNELLPDLATDLPTVSEDGLTYTFTLKQGLMYAPPYQDVEITAPDFVRAIEREACDACAAEGYPFYYSIIEGFDDSEGEPGSVSGAVAVDDYTLEITLTQPAGDFSFLMAMPAMTPIPEGATEGAFEKNYGRFLAQTGPYMFEGSEQIDPAAGTEAPGYDPGRSWTLVRNPSWDQDDVRGAYVDEIIVEINENTDVNFQEWEAGDNDMVYDGVPPPQVLQQYQGSEQLHVNPSDGVRYVAMNVAQPPFDDIHVRKAMNFVLDKDAMRQTRGGPLFGEIANHTIPDTLLDFQLQDYNPYPSPNSQGDIEAAKAEMQQSAYDSDGDGVCDAPECEDVLLIADREDPYPDQNAIIVDGAEQIGITFDVREGDRYTFMYDICDDPTAGWGLCPSPGWFKDYPDAASFGLPLFDSSAIESSNYSLLGATPEDLQDWGYSVSEVPSVDAKVDECLALPVGDERITCWAELDQDVMEDAVPWIPFLFDNDVDLAGPRIQNYTYDSSAGLMSLDQIWLAEGGAAA